MANEEINVTSTPNGHRRPWLYELTGNLEVARPWLTNRVGDLESRLETIESVANSLANATTRTTVEGKKARRIHRTISRLREDLADITEG